MTVLIGTAPDQVPTNGMLGTLAFKDEEGYLFSQTMPAIKPTLNLDFINSKQVDPRITFARGTTATYYDGKTTALAEQNLLTYSQNYTAGTTIWQVQNGTVTVNSTTAPDGTTTASTYTPDISNQTHALSSGSAQGLGLGTVTLSCYIKAGTYNYVTLRLVANITTWVACTVDLSLGAITKTASNISTYISSTISSVGSGWYRVTLTGLCSIASGVSINIASSSTPSYQTSNYGNDPFLALGTETVYVWGAQLEQRSSATAYTPTTTTPITNYIPQLMTAPMNVPRLDYDPITGKPLGLLIEESRANLLSYSQDFSNAVWIKLNVPTINNTIIAPDGTLTASKLISDSFNGGHYLNNTSITLPSSTYTYSYYIKSGEYVYTGIVINNSISVIFNSNTNTFSTPSGSPTNYTSTYVGNGWYRITLTVSSVAITSVQIYSLIANNFSASTGNGYSGIYIWGAQLEAGTFATSYIPTTTGSVTRNADQASMTGTNFSSWYNQSQGSFYIECNSYCSYLQSAYSLIVDDSTINNRIDLRISYTTLGKLRSQILGNGSTLSNIVESSADLQNNIFTKDAISVSVGNHTAIRNGVIIGTAVISSVPAATRIIFGSNPSSGEILNGHIKKIAYYPQALSTAELQGLTS